MEKICLGYDSVIQFLRGDPSVVEKLRYYADREEICLTPFTMVHLLETINKKEVLTSFLANVTVLSFDRRAAVIYNKILIEQGKSTDDGVLDFNVMIAAICIANNAFLLTKATKRFDGIKGLKKV